MKKLILFYLLFSLINNVFSQPSNFLWAKRLGGIGYDIGNSITHDLQGNVYTTGCFSDTVDFDPGPGIYNMISSSGTDIFVSKLDAFGNFLWAKQLGGATLGEDIGYSIAVDANGNVYTSGRFYSTADFDPGPENYYLTSNCTCRYSYYISKLDAFGNFLWAKQFGGTSDNDKNSIALDLNGNVYTIGNFAGTSDFDPGPGIHNLTSIGLADVFISKLDNSGNFVWVKQVGGAEFGFNYSIAVDKNGNVYTTSSFAGTADFDPGAETFNMTSGISWDIFISKLDPSGNFIWAKQLGGTYENWSSSIAVDVNENVYTTGTFSDTTDFDPGLGIYQMTCSRGSSNIFVSKLNALGNFTWAKQLGEGGIGWSNSLAIDAKGEVFTIGSFSGTADFDPGSAVYNLTSTGRFPNIFVSQLDALGNLVWVKQLKGAGEGWGYSIAVDVKGNVYTTGVFSKTTDFDPGVGVYNMTFSGEYDIFILKLGQNFSINTNYPKLYLSSSSLNAGQSVTIAGFDFTSNGKVKLNISSPSGFSQNNSLTIASNGSFVYSFASNTSMPSGIYNVSAIDSISGNSSPVKSFQLTNNTLSTGYLKITSPAINISSKVNSAVKIEWTDKPSHISTLIPNTSVVHAQYKIEYNRDNTGWQLIDIKTYAAFYQQVSTFPYDYTPTQTGVYTFRVSDMDDAANTDISATVTVNNDPSGVVMNYDWDYSGNRPSLPPLGVAADGTARIYVRISKKPGNNKSISNVVLTVRDSSNLSITNTSLLGKVF